MVLSKTAIILTLCGIPIASFLLFVTFAVRDRYGCANPIDCEKRKEHPRRKAMDKCLELPFPGPR